MTDIVVIGAGPAGLTAALYALRGGMSVQLIEKQGVGGQIATSPKVENMPGFTSVSGMELADSMFNQVMELGAEIELDEVTGVEKTENGWVVKGVEGAYDAKCVIIAAGAQHRKLGIEHEEELVGRGISYCAVCDGAFFKGKDVAVIGGGSTALQDAILLSQSCENVWVIYRGSAFKKAEQAVIRSLEARQNIRVLFDTVVTGVKEEGGMLSSLILDGPSAKELKVDGMFVAIGLEPENAPFAAAAGLDNWGYIASGEDCRTASEGLFVAGDCRAKTVRQLTTAMADGTVAALAAIEYIENHN